MYRTIPGLGYEIHSTPAIVAPTATLVTAVTTWCEAYGANPSAALLGAGLLVVADRQVIGGLALWSLLAACLTRSPQGADAMTPWLDAPIMVWPEAISARFELLTVAAAVYQSGIGQIPLVDDQQRLSGGITGMPLLTAASSLPLLTRLTAQTALDPPSIQVAAQSSLATIAQQMIDRQVAMVRVASNAAAAIVTAVDIFQQWLAGVDLTCGAAAIGRRVTIAVRPTASLRHCLAQLQADPTGAIAVVDDEGQTRGVLTGTDILRVLQPNRLCDLATVPQSDSADAIAGSSQPETSASMSGGELPEPDMVTHDTHYRALVQAIPDLLMRVGRDGIYRELFVTPDFPIRGNPQDLVGQHVRDGLPDEIAAQRLQYIERALDTQMLQVYEQDLSTVERIQIEEVRVVPFNSDEVLLLSRDISDRKQAELALKHSQAQNQAILSAIPDFMFRLGLDGRYRGIVTPQSDFRIVGQEQVLAGEFASNVLPPDLAALQLEHLKRAIATGDVQQYEQQIICDGHIQQEEVRVVKSGNDEALFMVRDITERKRIEAALQHSEQTNRSIIEALPDLLIRMTRQGFYHDMWAGTSVRVKRPEPSAEQPDVFAVLTPELAEQRLYYTGLALDTQTVQSYEHVFHIDGEDRAEEIRISPINDHEVLVIVRDVTDRKQAEQALHELNQLLEQKVIDRTIKLQESESQLRAMIEAIPDLLLRVNRQGDCLDYIESPYRVGTFLPILHHISEVLSPMLLQRQLTAINRAIATKQVQIYTQALMKDNHAVYEEVRIVAISDDEALVIVQDITDRCNTEQENRRLKERLEFLLSSSPAVIYSCQFETQSQLTFMSDNSRDILGYESEQFLSGEDFWSHQIHPDDLERYLLGRSQILSCHISQDDLVTAHPAHKDIYTAEYRFRHGDGHYIWLYDEICLVRDRTNSPTEIIGYCANISDRKEAEAALQASQQFIQTVMNTVPLSIFWKDQNSVFLGCNQELARTLGLSSTADIVGKTDFDFSMTETEALSYQADDRLVMQAGQVKLRIEEPITLADGKQRWIETNKAPLRNQKGQIIGLVGAFQDITQRKQFDLQLQQTNEELARATRLKDEFLANMSHELRTPLNAILGMTEGLKEGLLGPINARQIKALGTIEQSGNHLLELINDILDIAKIESGQMELNPSVTIVSQLCQSSLNFIKHHAAQKNIQITVAIAPNIPPVLIDERRVRQVLINLLNNAVKFTPEGGEVNLTARFQSQTAEGDRPAANLEIAIADSGIGIAPEYLNLLFEPFMQIDSALNRKYEGTGLGLALVKRIVELHQGHVAVSSALGEGSCFTVCLPISDEMLPVTSPSLVLQTPSNLPSNRSLLDGMPTVSTDLEVKPLILLAEDNEANIMTISSYLRAKGYRLCVARDGRAAIAMTATEQPDLILMDVQMPEVNGLEAIIQIRQQASHRTLPIIALTAFAMSNDRDRCLAAGANAYLSKPVKLKELVAMIQQQLAAISS